MISGLPGEIAVLRHAMAAAGWHSDDTRVLESVPHMSSSLAPQDFVATLRNLGIPLGQAAGDMADIQAADCPVLFFARSGHLTCILDRRDNQILVSTLAAPDPRWQQVAGARGRLVRLETFADMSQDANGQSGDGIFAGFKAYLPGLILSSTMTNLMALTVPLLIMVIYDRVIPTQSTDLIWSLVLAVVLVLICDASFRYARASALAQLGGDVEHKLGLALFTKLTLLPLAQIQKSSVDQQITRFKQFEGLRDVFSGQLLSTLLDLPFTVFFLAFLFVIAPPVGWLILALICVFILATMLTLPAQKRLNAIAGTLKSHQQQLQFETVTQQRNLHRLGLGDHWQQRDLALGRQAATAARKAKQFQLISQAFGQSLMTVAGVGAIVLGTLAAMNDSLSFGALIAVMALVWKVLTPMQALYSSASQVNGFVKSRQQVERVLSLPEELVRGVTKSHQKTFQGKVSFSGVTHRYDAMSDPALLQVSLDIAAREFVAVCGVNSSGKSTLLNLIAGLSQPTTGTISLDDIDLRQIAVDDLRRSFGYAPKATEFFHGTLAQNFRLAAPTATDHDITQAIAAVGLSDDVRAFPQGINTRLSESYRRTLPAATFRALGVARSFCTPGQGLVLDEPGVGLDTVRKAALLAHLGTLKGQKTIVVATDDPDLIALADRCIFLDHGRLVANDCGPIGQKKIMALLQNIGG